MPGRRDSNQRLRLTPRDMTLLEDLFWHRLMSSRQILRLGYFSSLSRCNRRLNQLRKGGWVLAYPEVPSVTGLSQVVRISRLGVLALLERGRVELTDAYVSYPEPSKSMAVHTLSIVQVRCLLSSPRIDLIMWLPEARCRHEYFVSGSNTARIFKPDAYAEIPCERGPTSFFIEVDLANSSRRQIEEKLRGYERYQKETFRETYGKRAFKVLFVTTTTGRCRQLESWTKSAQVPVALTTMGGLLKDAGTLIGGDLR